MTPIRQGDGTGVTPTGISEVRTGDGRVVFTPGSAIPDSGISRWEFEDDSDATTALDSWGDNDGSINGATYTSNAAEGSLALSFDGVDDYVEFAGTSGIDFSGTFSISIWAYPDFEADGTGFDRILTKSTSYSSGDQEWTLQQDGTNDAVQWSYNYGNATLGAVTITPQTYVHLVFVRESDGTIRLYKDGNEVDSAASSAASSNSAPIRLGAVGGLQSSTFYRGDADDPRLYNKALTATEVSDLYSTGSI